MKGGLISIEGTYINHGRMEGRAGKLRRINCTKNEKSLRGSRSDVVYPDCSRSSSRV